MKLVKICDYFGNNNLISWMNNQKSKFVQVANLVYKIKKHETPILTRQVLNELDLSLAFLNYLNGFSTLNYFYLLVEEKPKGIIAFDISQFAFTKKHLIFSQTGLISENPNDIFKLMEFFKQTAKEVIEKEKPEIVVSYLKPTSHNKRLLKWAEKNILKSSELIYEVYIGEVDETKFNLN